jgi:SAM-dependent methyltransferase
MLKDAALLELDLALAALAEGLTTKDATPYNVQFVGARPLHIDIGSFEPLTEGEPWFGYGQFCRQFLNPLVLTARRGIQHQSVMRGSLRGLSAADCAASLRWRDLLRPSLFVHVGLQAHAERKPTTGRDVRAELKAAGFGPKVIEAQLRRLRGLVEGLVWDRSSSVWSDYSSRAHYPDEDLRAKKEFVEHAAGLGHRRQVLDLGANDGYFSELVLPTADYVVAVDSDPAVLDRLYQRLRQRGEHRLLPLVLDLVDLADGLGWRGKERVGFLSRINPDLVLCLALIHHLVITESIPVEEVIEFLLGFGAELILEFPTQDDDMVQLLMQQKMEPRLFQDRYDLKVFEACLSSRFAILERIRVGRRMLYHLRPRQPQQASVVADGKLAEGLE